MSTRGAGLGIGLPVWMRIASPATWLLDAGSVRRWITRRR